MIYAPVITDALPLVFARRRRTKFNLLAFPSQIPLTVTPVPTFHPQILQSAVLIFNRAKNNVPVFFSRALYLFYLSSSSL